MNPSDNDDTEPVEDVVEAEEEEPEEIIEKFMSSEITDGLDNHSDLSHNPVMLYEVKKAKDVARRERRKQQMIAEGMDEEDAERALLDAENLALEHGTTVSTGRQNAMAMLISVGARFTSARAEGVEAAAAEERKRATRSIESWLSKVREIDTRKKERKKSSTRKNAMNALQMALATKKVPFGGDSMKLEIERIEMAKVGRNLLRDTYGRAKRLPTWYHPPKKEKKRPEKKRREGHDQGEDRHMRLGLEGKRRRRMTTRTRQIWEISQRERTSRTTLKATTTTTTLPHENPSATRLQKIPCV
jgi:hypothetical protein